MAGGWRYLWTDGAVGERGLVVRAWWWVCVRCLCCLCVPCRCCAWWMVCRRGSGSCVGGMSWGRVSRLVKQEFEEVGLSVWGRAAACCRYLWVRYDNLLHCLGNGRPFHVRCCGQGVFRMGA